MANNRENTNGIIILHLIHVYRIDAKWKDEIHVSIYACKKRCPDITPNDITPNNYGDGE